MVRGAIAGRSALPPTLSRLMSRFVAAFYLGFVTVAQIAFLFCCLVWGTSFILLERVTHVMGPVEIAIWRMLTGAAVVGCVLVD